MLYSFAVCDIYGNFTQQQCCFLALFRLIGPVMENARYARFKFTWRRRASDLGSPPATHSVFESLLDDFEVFGIGHAVDLSLN
jgi:hypothetical protein